MPEVGRAVVGLAERGPRRPSPMAVTVVAIAAQPRPVARWSASANGRPVRKTAAIGSSSGVEGPEVVGEQGRLLGRAASSPRRARRARSSDAWRRWYTVPTMAQRTGSRRRWSATGRPAAPRPGESRRVPALVRRPRDRPAGPLPGDADATRGDRAVLRRAGRRARGAGDGGPRARPTGWSGRARSASSMARTARRCTTSRSARRTPGARATAPRRRS